MELKARVLIAGDAEGEALLLHHPISFWGGVDPKSGDIIDARHPDRGVNIAGKILVLPGMIGSSSASAVMLELVHANRAPAALILPEPDAILLLGLVVAREMDWPHPPAFALDEQGRNALRGKAIRIDREGVISLM